MISHQRKIRDDIAEREKRPPMSSLDGCEVREIKIDDARPVIMTYEWLGTLPTAPRYQCGLFTPDNELIGVAMFGNGPGTRSGLVCGEEFADRVLCLERGACVHYAHEHAASFLIARACRLIHREHGVAIFYAYADPEAGEIGTIYQACNWQYIGQGVGRSASWRYKYIAPDGSPWCTSFVGEMPSRRERAVRARCGHTLEDHITIGWQRRRHEEKHKYIHFEGSKADKRELCNALRFPALPYPKRTEFPR